MGSTLKIKIKKWKFLTQIDFKLLLFTAYNLAYVMYMLGYLPRAVNLGLLVVFVLYNAIIYVRKNNFILSKRFAFWTETAGMIQTFILFAVISLIIQLINGNLQLSLISYYLYLFLPLIVAYVWSNTTKPEKMPVYFYVLLGRFILNFLMSNWSNLAVNAISMISFSNSKSSIFESSDAHMFFILVIIFMYMGKKIPAWISGIFCMLCFKRLCFILTPVVLLGYRFIPRGATNKKLILLGKVFFILSPLIVLFLNNNIEMINKLFDIDLNDFVSGRFDLVNYVMDNIGSYNGYGSITDFMTRHPWGKYVKITFMHCDVLQLYLETTIIGLVVFTHNFFNIGKRDYIRFIIVLYFAFEMFTSHFIDVMAAWMLLYMFAAMQSAIDRDNRLRLENEVA